MATMVMPTYYNVMSYVHYLPCYYKNSWP